ncbi:hypothetical protein X777_05279 [Ooceraea biroi]|uniref:DUF4817 domain-containing protein n=1 Tax=Ooceraea biroi TaxID=2015173 RepID=A0A026WJ84_OOCBI|nr:hypothetical protein X777_05279 [Ooceraea biroi]
MIKIVGLCNDNLKAAQRVYAARFPDRRHPTRKTMKLLFRRAQQGNLKRNRSRVLRFVKFHPYDIVLTQQLQAGDFNRRLQFYNWARNQYRRDPYFFMHVLFTDEATFTNRGGLNRHNWSNNNPQ